MLNHVKNLGTTEYEGMPSTLGVLGQSTQQATVRVPWISLGRLLQARQKGVASLKQALAALKTDYDIPFVIPDATPFVIRDSESKDIALVCPRFLSVEYEVHTLHIFTRLA